MNKYSFGRRKEVTYNPSSGKVCGSDSNFLVLTLTLILVPSVLCFVVVILMNPHFRVWEKAVLTLVYALSLFLCLNMLFKCSFTDPGIIPVVAEQDGGE